MKKCISIILVSWLSMYSLAYAGKSNTLILITAQNMNQTQQAIDFIEANGGEVRHVFPPNVLIGYVPLDFDHKLIGHSLISQVLHEKVDPSDYLLKDKTSMYAVNAWNDLLMETDENRYDREDLPQPLPLVGDAYPPLEQLQNETGQSFIKSSTVPHTSWYMIGRVAVGIILMESNGSAENWTSEKEQATISEIVQGHERLSSFAYDKKISVTWFYDIHYQVPTPSEPIQQDHVPRYVILPYPHWVYGWVNDALDHLGYDDGHDGMYEYVNDRRAQFQTEWGYMIFVVMDENDPDHMFPDEGNWFAYAEHQGPWMVMTYYNDNWYPSYMDQVLQHETCHIFGAKDEYADGCGSGDCDNTYGYLHVVNGNCESCNSNPDSCIMRSRRNEVVLCNYTNGQIGWRDSDGNYIPDPLDMGTQHSENLWDVYPGDLITIYNTDGQLVKVISVSPDNCAVRLYSDRSVTLWDATNNTGDAVAYAQYFWKVNGASRGNLLWYMDTYAPYFTECSLQNCTLYFRLHDQESAGGYVTITVFDADWNVVDYVMRHKFLTCRDAPGEPLHEIQVPSELLSSGSNIKLSCSDGGGNDASPVVIPIELDLSSPANLTATVISLDNQVLLGWDDTNCGTAKTVIEMCRVDGYGDICSQDTVDEGIIEHLHNATTGSNIYYYRARALRDGELSSASNVDSIRTHPNPPTNVFVENWYCNRPYHPAKMNLSGSQSINTSKPTSELGCYPPFPDSIPSDLSVVYADYPEYQCHGTYAGLEVWSKSCKWYNQNYIRKETTAVDLWHHRILIHTPPDTIWCSDWTYYFKIRTIDIYGDTSIFVPENWGWPYACCVGPCRVHFGPYPVMFKPEIPDGFSLEQNYPNPFNPETQIRYALPQATTVKLVVYNILGQKVRTLLDEDQTAGYKTVHWDGKGQDGDEMSSGIYFYRLQAGEYNEVRKMIMLK